MLRDRVIRGIDVCGVRSVNGGGLRGLRGYQWVYLWSFVCIALPFTFWLTYMSASTRLSSPPTHPPALLLVAPVSH